MKQETRDRAHAALMSARAAGGAIQEECKHFPMVFVVGKQIYFFARPALRAVREAFLLDSKELDVEVVSFEEALKSSVPVIPRDWKDMVDWEVDQTGELYFGESLFMREALLKKMQVINPKYN